MGFFDAIIFNASYIINLIHTVSINIIEHVFQDEQ
jgi:hypothetical protein